MILVKISKRSLKFLVLLIWIMVAVLIYIKFGIMPDKEKEVLLIEDNDTDYNSGETEANKEKISVTISEKDANLTKNPNIRVIIMSDGFKSIYHDNIIISCDDNLVIDYNDVEHIQKADDKLNIDKKYFSRIIKNKKYKGSLCLKGGKDKRLRIHNIKRNGLSNDALELRGLLELYYTEQGIVVVNELPVEEYLYGVVQSEMPATYPMEALKAQAICARTYAYYHQMNYAYPEYKANVNDSTDFQVYMNIPETEQAVKAVDETANKIIVLEEKPVQSFYFSTSGGFLAGNDAWAGIGEILPYTYLKQTGDSKYSKLTLESETEYNELIDNGNCQDIEYNEPWYRWNYTRDVYGKNLTFLLKNIEKISNISPNYVIIRSRNKAKDEFTKEKGIKDIRILDRRDSGLVVGLMIETENYTVTVNTQYYVRMVFAKHGDTVVKNDGSTYEMGTLLPSAFLYFELLDKNGNLVNKNGDTVKEDISKIVIHGAGLGHGSGMSQNGAKCLANKGFTAEEILAYYYDGEIIIVK